MAALTIQEPVEAGLEPTYEAAADAGDTAKHTQGKTLLLHVKNGDGSPHTITVPIQRAQAEIPGLGPVTKSSIAVAVPAGEERIIGPIPEAYVKSDGNIDITYGGDATSVTIAALLV